MLTPKIIIICKWHTYGSMTNYHNWWRSVFFLLHLHPLRNEWKFITIDRSKIAFCISGSYWFFLYFVVVVCVDFVVWWWIAVLRKSTQEKGTIKRWKGQKTRPGVFLMTRQNPLNFFSFSLISIVPILVNCNLYRAFELFINSHRMLYGHGDSFHNTTFPQKNEKQECIYTNNSKSDMLFSLKALFCHCSCAAMLFVLIKMIFINKNIHGNKMWAWAWRKKELKCFGFFFSSFYLLPCAMNSCPLCPRTHLCRRCYCYASIQYFTSKTIA